ncbi:MAG: M3 family metallopeptidase [Proteobacteria bacterium]|nr:M3 family metallopeptidase [Pseudomonadota bacterium]
MRKILLATASAAALLAVTAGPADAAKAKRHHAAAPAPKPADNPLLADWAGPHGGVPPFDKVKVSDFKPALEAAMAENLREVLAIADNPAPATFDNTIRPLEDAGRKLNRVQTVMGVWSSTMSSPELQAVEAEMSPKLAAFGDEITQNPKLFARIQAVWDGADKAGLTPEQKRLVWVYWNGSVQQGAKLSPADKAKYGEYNQKLATLYTKFAQNELWDEEHYALTLDSQAGLAGLPQSQIDGAAAEAERRGQKGHWVIANTRSSMEPFLTYSSRRDLREKGWRMWVSRGDNGDAHDNNAIAAEILQLRAKRSQLLGYPTYAHWHLADAMAKTPDNAMALMLGVWKPAVDQVHKDVADMQAIVDAEHGGFKIQPWDYRYYAEKVRKAKYDLDLNEVKPYLQLEKVREAMFWSAGRLYGYSFAEVKGLPTALPEIRVYEVKDRAGKHVGLWYFDPYARPGKRSGAWMNAYRNQERFAGEVTTIVSNNANFIKGRPGEPVTISWDDAKTMFHEFGHALHGLSSDVTYPSLSGTAVDRDYVEFPSQFNENYLTTPEVLNRFLVNAQGQPMPPALIAKINKAHTFNEGFDTVELLASAIVDMRLHLEGDKPVDTKAFEKKVLGELGMPSEIVMRHRIPQFGHVFQGEGYAAGYYGYIWAEVLDHDAFEAFEQAGDPYDPATAKRMHDEVLKVGNTIDPAEAYRRFRGRDPKVDALLRDHGFPVPDAKAAAK